MKASVESIPVTPRAPAALKAAADTSTSQVTQTVRAGIECGDATGCVIPPLHLSSTFAFRGFADKGAYDYTRSGNPTRDLLGAALAELERGAGAVVTASGMAAVTLVGYLVPALGRIVAPHDCYGGTYRLFDAWRRRGPRCVRCRHRDALPFCARTYTSSRGAGPRSARPEVLTVMRRWLMLSPSSCCRSSSARITLA